MRSLVDWIAMPASGVNCSIRRAKLDRERAEEEEREEEEADAGRDRRARVPQDRADAECGEGVRVRRSAVPTTARAALGSVTDTSGYAGGA